MKKLVAAALVMAFASPAFASDSECTATEARNLETELRGVIPKIATYDSEAAAALEAEIPNLFADAKEHNDYEFLCAIFEMLIEEASGL